MHKRLLASVLLCSLLGVTIGLSLACNQAPDTAYSLSERFDIKIRSLKITAAYEEKEYLRTLQLLQELQEKYPVASEAKLLPQQLANLSSLAVQQEVDRPAKKLAAKVKIGDYKDSKEEKLLSPEGKAAVKEQKLADAYSRAMQTNYPVLYAGVEYVDARNSVTILINENWNVLPPEAKQDFFKQTVILWSATSQALSLPVNYDNLQIEIRYGSTHELAASWDGQEGYALY